MTTEKRPRALFALNLSRLPVSLDARRTLAVGCPIPIPRAFLPS